MVNFSILAGGYDTFVATYIFNTITLTLSLVGRSPTGANPSWVTQNPNNQSLLYATNENTVGALQSFLIDPTTKLLSSSPVDTIPSDGNGPAYAGYISSTNQVAVMNYGSGNGRFVSLDAGGGDFNVGRTARIGNFSLPVVPSPGQSHPHEAVEIGFGDVLVPDLGADMIYRLLRSEESGEWNIHGSFPQPKGSGPRHVAVLDDRLFALHELASTLSVQSLPPVSSKQNSTIYATVSTIPPISPPGAQWAAAEIILRPPTARFPKPYIYTSNRNTEPNAPASPGDSIAIFEHVNKGTSSEGLRLVKQVYTGLNQIRGMMVGKAGEESEEFLVASGVAGSGGVVVFRRVDGGSDLVEVARNTEIPTRSSFVWL